MSDTRRIVITGVSRGLGNAMAAGFIECGHAVYGCARSGADVRRLAGHWPAPHGFDVVDISNDDDVAAWADRVLQTTGPPDLLVNNAAIINANAPLWSVPVQDFDACIDINIKGTANVIRHFVPAMIDHGEGVIVNFSSTWGRSVSPEVAPYCATKWAVEGLTRALAEELPAPMSAVPLNPGIINTDMLQSCFGSGASAYPSPQKWAEQAVPFLLQIGRDDNGRPLTVPS